MNKSPYDMSSILFDKDFHICTYLGVLFYDLFKNKNKYV